MQISEILKALEEAGIAYEIDERITGCNLETEKGRNNFLPFCIDRKH